MQFTGHAGRHLSQPEHSSGMITTSGTVVEDGAELGRAVPQAGVAVDALGHLDAQRDVLPLRVALALPDRARGGPALAAEAIAAASPCIDPRVKGWWTGAGMADAPGGSPTRAGSASSSCSTRRRRSSPSGATPTPASSTSAPAPAWPRASSTGTSRTRKRCSPSSCARCGCRLRTAQADAIDPDADPLDAHPPGHRGVGAVHGPAPRVLRAPRGRSSAPTASPPCSARAPRSTPPTPPCWSRRRKPKAQVPEDRDPQLLALGVVGAVAHFSHFHRSGRIEMDVDDLADFVGDWVTAALRN